jgi:hypothetical protein
VKSVEQKHRIKIFSKFGFGYKKIFEDLVNDEEQHFDKYDTKLNNIYMYGKKHLAFQFIVRRKNRGAAPAESVTLAFPLKRNVITIKSLKHNIYNSTINKFIQQ